MRIIDWDRTGETGIVGEERILNRFPDIHPEVLKKLERGKE